MKSEMVGGFGNAGFGEQTRRPNGQAKGRRSNSNTSYHLPNALVVDHTCPRINHLADHDETNTCSIANDWRS